MNLLNSVDYFHSRIGDRLPIKETRPHAANLSAACLDFWELFKACQTALEFVAGQHEAGLDCSYELQKLRLAIAHTRPYFDNPRIPT